MSTLRLCHFRLVLFCVLYIRVHVTVIQQQYVPHKYYCILLRSQQSFKLLPRLEGFARDTHRAECALSAAPIRNGANAEATAYAKLGGWDGQYFSYNPLFFCLARLEQSNDQADIRYRRHWSQLMEPSHQFLR